MENRQIFLYYPLLVTRDGGDCKAFRILAPAYLRKPPLLFRRLRPRKTTHHAVSRQFDILLRKSGISRLVTTLSHLPSILHIQSRLSPQTCSKGARVLPSSRWYSASSGRIQFH
ncbi:hypothetical protein MPTK1_8g18790 [Marchantia polymorpha subsp. ruderalis]|uniref:Uncharacterized protein n=1 Tax=Marchantia polymorpha TaxID=3197 RepID=A0A2R6W858_MARPO|nr:hypothetical protein MARPO_0131s0024 [Marchantia polymorpha]BBN20400.1 hypothetical protein Mp_8g18790 [Marchantia polymorpha subsp. ruderalis]|eukprot:PTQ30027.1 hypothetical protein MARPO_0131s0024 [Marchantia polymorpha]